MTPPSAKPEANSTIGSEDDATSATDSDEGKGGKVTRLRTGEKRRTGAMRLRLARNASADDGADGDGNATGPRTGMGRGARAAKSGGGRFAGKGNRTTGAGQRDSAEEGLIASPGTDKVEARVGSVLMAKQSSAKELTAASMLAPVAAPANVQSAPAIPYTVADETLDADEAEPVTRRRKKSAPAPQRGKVDLSSYVVAPTVSPARLRKRHYGVILLFILMVILLPATYAGYLWTYAADQFESDVGFASRSEQAPSPLALLGALGGASSTGANNMDILNQFIISQEVVSRIDRKLDLRHIYSKPTNDPLMAFDPKGTIEDLVKYWQRRVIVNYDSTAGFMNLQVFAFDPQDARNIAQAVLDESTAIINDLSNTALDDATRYSKEALDTAEAKLSKARTALTDFRVTNHFVDPATDLASQVTVVGTLIQQLATAEVDLGMLVGTVTDNDPRVALLKRRIDVTTNQISEERAKVGAVPDNNAPGYAALADLYQSLTVDLTFAQTAYLSALASYDTAILAAQQKTQYLATYLSPTMAEQSTAPNRPLLAALAVLVAFLLWSVLVLVYYALRDRR